MALKVLQDNLNHCEAAHDQQTQTVREKKVDVVIIADQYRNLDGFTCKTDARLRACGKQPLQEVVEDSEDTFVYKWNAFLQLLHAVEYVARRL